MARKPRAKSKPRKRQQIQRRRLAKDDFGEKLMRRKGAVDPNADLEF